jgi:predicted DNA-binding WGR domain protein
MTSLHILLEARSAVRRCWRAYEIEVGADLFGAWLVEMSYGRIGTMGRSKIRSFATAADAQAEVNGCLRKRASAPRRIGVAYRLRRASQAADWSQPGLDDRLYVWFGGAGWADHPNLALSQVQIGGTQPTIPPFERADLGR